jgi:hypothetical protein
LGECVQCHSAARQRVVRGGTAPSRAAQLSQPFLSRRQRLTALVAAAGGESTPGCTEALRACMQLLADTQTGDAKSSLGDVKSSLGDAKSSLGDAKSSLGDAESSLGDAKSSPGDTKSSRWVTLRARWVTLRRVCMRLLADTLTVVVHEREALHRCLATLLSVPAAAASLGPTLDTLHSARTQVELAALQLASQGHPVATKVRERERERERVGVISG